MTTKEAQDLAAKIRDYVEYRHSQLDSKRRALVTQQQQVGAIGASLMQFDQQSQVANVALGELENFATWVEDGSPEWVPPLSKVELEAWQFAADHGAEIPPHIQVQLDAL